MQPMLLWLAVVALLVTAALAAIITNQPRFTTLFTVLAVMLLVLPSVLPSPEADERAKQHRELVSELAEIRRQVEAIRQLVARADQLASPSAAGRQQGAPIVGRSTGRWPPASGCCWPLVALTAAVGITGIVRSRCGRRTRGDL
jgi:hypothetical protein